MDIDFSANLLFIFGANSNIASHRIRSIRLKTLSIPNTRVIYCSSLSDTLFLTLSKLAILFSSPWFKIFLFPKPRSPLHFLLIKILKALFHDAVVIVDVTDDILTLDRAQFCFHEFIHNVRCWSFLRSLRSADVVVVPTMGLSSLFLSKYNLSSVIISDYLDIDCAPLSCRLNPFRNQGLQNILWFGNSGFKSRFSSSKKFQPSGSLETLVRHLRSELISNCTITLCTNHLESVYHYLSTSGIPSPRFNLVQWSPLALSGCLSSADTVFLSYSSSMNGNSGLKSLNRIELALYSGLPCVIVNPPMDHDPSNLFIRSTSPHSYISSDHPDFQSSILIHPSSHALDLLLEAQASIDGDWIELITTAYLIQKNSRP